MVPYLPTIGATTGAICRARAARPPARAAKLVRLAATAMSTFAAMTIEPDTKDWTWVLDERCPECGFEAAGVAPGQVAGLVRDNTAAWLRVLTRPRAELAARPSDDCWSALEYACHVRDLLRIADERVALMLERDDPDFANWDQDETAVADRYHEQHPAEVSAALEQAAAAFADRLDGVSGDGWQRTGNRSDGAAFTVGSYARYLIHDPVHHLDDVGKGLAALAADGGRAEPGRG